MDMVKAWKNIMPHIALVGCSDCQRMFNLANNRDAYDWAHGHECFRP